jgi:hypothetical protein
MPEELYEYSCGSQAKWFIAENKSTPIMRLITIEKFTIRVIWTLPLDAWYMRRIIFIALVQGIGKFLPWPVRS